MEPGEEYTYETSIAARIDRERLDAAQQEFQRHERVRCVELAILDEIAAQVKDLTTAPFSPEPEQLLKLLSLVDGLREVVAGEWVQSPRAMQQQRSRAKGQAA